MLVDADGCALWVEVAGPEQAPVLMLSNSLGTNLTMWDAQIAAFAARFRVIRYDRRGHGKSAVPPGPTTMERLARDALSILDALGVRKAHWCGLSMGGMEGMWLGANAPERFGRIVLANTSPYYPDKSIWNDRMAAIRANGGLAALTDRVIGLWLSPDFRARSPQETARLTAMLTTTPVEGYLGCCAAIRDMDHRPLLPRIKVATLVIAGRYDLATPLKEGQLIASEIPGAALTVLDAAHISNVEQPTEFTETVLGFLTR
jgi:3-oxoadipate enol-lactonase